MRAIFDDLGDAREQGTAAETRPAGALIRRLERQLMSDVFRWTGHFPEKTRTLMRDLAKRADALEQVYPRDAESAAIVGVTILVTSLAMNFVHRGAYFPETAGQSAAVAEPREPRVRLDKDGGGGAGRRSARPRGSTGSEARGQTAASRAFLRLRCARLRCFQRSIASSAMRFTRSGYSMPCAFAAIANSLCSSR